jgi:hypothetical protein
LQSGQRTLAGVSLFHELMFGFLGRGQRRGLSLACLLNLGQLSLNRLDLSPDGLSSGLEILELRSGDLCGLHLLNIGPGQLGTPFAEPGQSGTQLHELHLGSQQIVLSPGHTLCLGLTGLFTGSQGLLGCGDVTRVTLVAGLRVGQLGLGPMETFGAIFQGGAQVTQLALQLCPLLTPQPHLLGTHGQLALDRFGLAMQLAAGAMPHTELIAEVGLPVAACSHQGQQRVERFRLFGS